MWLLLVFLSILGVFGNKFGNDFEVIKHNSSEYAAYAYADQTMCYVHHELRHAYVFVHIRSINTFDASYPLVYSLKNLSGSLRVDGCFSYEGHSYLWMHDPLFKRVVVIRGMDVIVANTTVSYDIGRYDYTDGHAYILSGNDLVRYRFSELLQTWASNSSHALPTSINHYTLPSFHRDFFVVGAQIFFTSENAFFRLEEENNWSLVTALPSNGVQYVLFRNTPSFEISASMPPMVLYLMQCTLLILLVYCLRYKLTLKGLGFGGAIELAPPTSSNNSAGGSSR